jgi:DNA polymerase V
MFALVDCNNFYCSCERVFNPSLMGRPVVVLSNNDGCIIARSEEAKALGIKMAVPEYMVRHILKQHNVSVFSSNYTLYGDMSDRVMKILGSFVPRLELYSIDEAFLDMRDLPHIDLLQLGMNIKRAVVKATGIPVTVGIGPTKTLAKLANRYAKKKNKELGVHWLANEHLRHEALTFTDIGDVWGIGSQHASFLTKHKIKTAADFLKAPEDWVRKQLTVVGHRLLNELKGIPSISFESETKQKQNICTSRSFGSPSQDKTLLAEAIANHAAACALKLRKQKTAAQSMNVFIRTSPFRPGDEQYSHSIDLQLPTATSHTTELIKYALRGLDIIFHPNRNFVKCGVIVSDLVPEELIQSNMFDTMDRSRGREVMVILDKVNRSLGGEIVRFASQGFEKRYRLKADYISRRYTTRIDEVIHVKN